MVDVSRELLLNVLKEIQRDISEMKTNYQEVRQELIAIRGHTTASQADIANLYAGQAKIEVHIEEIRKRLSVLVEPAE